MEGCAEGSCKNKIPKRSSSNLFAPPVGGVPTPTRDHGSRAAFRLLGDTFSILIK